MPLELDGLHCISWVPSALIKCSWGSSGVLWCTVGLPLVLYSRRKSDQKHFFMFSSPLVVCSIPCHRCMSCWAWERNCFGCFRLLADEQVNIVDECIYTLGDWGGSVGGFNFPLVCFLIVCIGHAVCPDNPSITAITRSLSHTIPGV